MVYEGSINSKLDLSPVMHRVINSSNADFLQILPSRMYFDKMLVEVHKFVFTQIAFEMPPAKCRPFCSGVNELMRARLTVR